MTQPLKSWANRRDRITNRFNDLPKNTVYQRILVMIIFVFSTIFAQTGLPVNPTQPYPQSQTQLNPELEKAIKDYHKLIEKYPDETALSYNLGNLHYLQGNLDSAIMDYQKALRDDNPKSKSHTLYNMGNTLFEQRNIQESVDFYKRALELNPDDKDIKHNYEFSKMILQQQEQQQEQNQQGDEKKEDEQQRDETEKNQEEQQNQEQQQSESDKEQSNQQEQSEDKELEQEKQQQQNSEEQKESEQQNPIQPQEMTEEEKRGKEEAEAILNALKASEENLMKKKYKAKGKIIMEKDW